MWFDVLDQLVIQPLSHVIDIKARWLLLLLAVILLVAAVYFGPPAAYFLVALALLVFGGWVFSFCFR